MTSINRSSKVGVMMAAILRHEPEKHNVSMRSDGNALVSEVSAALTQWFRTTISVEDIVWQVENDTKGRYGITEIDGKMFVKAFQGHSFEIEHEMTELSSAMIEEFNGVCFHGSQVENLESILKTGLNSGKRTFTHLSKDIETARKVASRRRGSKIVIFSVDLFKLKEMSKTIFISENGVILVDSVPVEAIVAFWEEQK